MRGVPSGLGELNARLSSELDRVIGSLRQGAVSVSGLLGLLAALIVLFSLFMPKTFPRATTLQAMMFQIPELGLLSLAMAIPLISGGINLAIIATANQAGLLMAWILTALMRQDASGMTVVLWLGGALAAGLLSCIVIGLVTGALVAVLGVHPILVTLGTMTLLHGVCIYFTRGRTLSGFPDALTAISNRTLWGVPISFVLFAIVAIAANILLTSTKLGVRIHMIGSNLESTRYSGIDTRRVQVWVYLISSILCWLAAVIMMARFNSAGADIAQSYLLITVLAAILGGVDPYGGFGRIAGLFIALWMLQVVASGFNLMNVSPHLALASWGVILLLVMTVTRVAPALRLAPRMKRSRAEVRPVTQPKTGGPVMNAFKIAGAESGSGNDHDPDEGRRLVDSYIATPPVPEEPRL
jgi:simple sugar transport system permease protein